MDIPEIGMPASVGSDATGDELTDKKSHDLLPPPSRSGRSWVEEENGSSDQVNLPGQPVEHAQQPPMIAGTHMTSYVVYEEADE